MLDRRKIKEEITLVDNLKMLAEAYEEISVVKMQRVRGSVLRTRDFLTDLSDVFFDVKGSYKKQILKLIEQKQKNTKLSIPFTHSKEEKNVISFSTLNKNGKEVVVLLSANTKLYGEIVPKVFSLFVQSIKDLPSDIVVVGKLGKDMFEQRKIDKKYTYFDIPDSEIKYEDLKPLASYILQYEKVTVFYGKFENVVNQVPVSSVISGEESLKKDRQGEKQEDFKFLFEPSLERILNFFETQIFTSIFKQTLHEYQLARYASRIKAMEEALENIHTKVNSLKINNRRAKKMYMNKKQNEVLSGISIWG